MAEYIWPTISEKRVQDIHGRSDIFCGVVIGILGFIECANLVSKDGESPHRLTRASPTRAASNCIHSILATCLTSASGSRRVTVDRFGFYTCAPGAKPYQPTCQFLDFDT